MFNFFKKKVTSDEVSSSLYLVIMDAGLTNDDYKDDDGTVLISLWQQRLLHLACVYDLLEKNGLDKIKWKLLSHWATHNCKTNDPDEHMEQMLKVLERIQEINKLFDPTPSQEEFMSKWLNIDIFGKDLDLRQKVLLTKWCFGHMKLVRGVLDSTLKKVKIID